MVLRWNLFLFKGTVELSADEDSQQYCFQLVFLTPENRTYYLSADCQMVMEAWMKAITCASYDYMKLMVAELERQLEEIDSRNKNQGFKNETSINLPKAPPRQRQNPFNKPSNTNHLASTSIATAGN